MPQLKVHRSGPCQLRLDGQTAPLEFLAKKIKLLVHFLLDDQTLLTTRLNLATLKAGDAGPP